MGIFSSVFGKPVDKVGPEVRLNTELVDAHMKVIHSNSFHSGDFIFEYLYTSSEQITSSGAFGSVIYIRVQSPVHESVAALPADSREVQASIDKHQKKFSSLPMNLSQSKTRWLYFNMGKIFRTC